MSTHLTTSDKGSIMESVLIMGDLSKLTPEQRSEYYMKVCESVRLNPLTRPFEYIILNGKLSLYAKKDATDQLRSIHKVSVEDLTESERDSVFIVTAKVRNSEGRSDMAKGAVNIGGLKGDALANALMKAETKAKRRATLSVCGLGFVLDETEIDSVPGATTLEGEPIGPKAHTRVLPYDVDPTKPKTMFKTQTMRTQYQNNVIDSLNKAITVAQLNEIVTLEMVKLTQLRESGDERDQMLADHIQNTYKASLTRLKDPTPPEDIDDDVPPYIEQQMQDERDRLSAKAMDF